MSQLYNSSADISNDDLAEYVNYVIASGLTIMEIADIMHVAPFMVERWAHEKANPHPNIRKIIVIELFKNAVKKCIERESNVIELAREHEVAESTVHRWVTGASSPLHLGKLQILRTIAKLK